MFEQFCKRPAALARHRDGPLVQERLAYLAHRAAQGMCIKSLHQAACYLLVVTDYLRLAYRPGEAIASDEIERQATRWAKRRSSQVMNRGGGRASRKVFRSQATNWLSFLRRLKPRTVSTSPHAGLISDFAQYMQQERGLSPETIRDRCRFVRRFLDQLGTPDGFLREVTIERIDA